jgi:hypothetical protein
MVVTRQSMNLVLRGLQDRGLVTRPSVADHGRARPTGLTGAGREELHTASVVIRASEQRMLAPRSSPCRPPVVPLSAAEQRRLCDDLARCAAAVSSH